MIQFIIIAVLLIISIAFLTRMVWKSFQGQTHCETGCGKCGEIQKSFEKIQVK